MRIGLVLLFWFCSCSLLSQQPLPQAQWQQAVGLASELAVDEERNLLLLHTPGNSITKYYAASRYDSSYSIGGAGTEGEGFRGPVRISIPNRSEVFVLDYHNRRLVVLNTNLRVVRSTDYDELPLRAQDGRSAINLYPIGFDAAANGELFVLNQDDARIYKFDQFGRFESDFGGTSYGAGSILHPSDVVAGADRMLYVPDTVLQRVQVYNNFGIYQYALQPALPYRWQRMSWGYDRLWFWAGQQLSVLHLPTGMLQHYSHAVALLDVVPKGNGAYILTHKRVSLHSFW